MADDEEDHRDSEAMISVPARGVLEQRAFDALETDIQQVPMRKQRLKSHFSTLSTSLIFPVFSMSLNDSYQIPWLSRLFGLLQFLTELQEEKHLDRFRAEYEKLHRAVKKAHGRYAAPICMLMEVSVILYSPNLC